MCASAAASRAGAWSACSASIRSRVSSDGNCASNFGVVTGLNAAMLLPGDAGDNGFGFQFGMTYGLYDLDGRVALRLEDFLFHQSLPPYAQQQTFVTAGFFRKADEDRPLSFGVVYNVCSMSDGGSLRPTATIGQWRGQVEYALSDQNGVGMYGACGIMTKTFALPVTGAAVFR